jgi:hypothetical protein
VDALAPDARHDPSVAVYIECHAFRLGDVRRHVNLRERLCSAYCRDARVAVSRFQAEHPSKTNGRRIRGCDRLRGRYLAVLVAPGPNLFAIGAIAALKGLRVAFPLCAGVAVDASG